MSPNHVKLAVILFCVNSFLFARCQITHANVFALLLAEEELPYSFDIYYAALNIGMKQLKVSFVNAIMFIF